MTSGPAGRVPVEELSDAAPSGPGPVISAHDVFCLYPTPRGHVAALRGLTLEVTAGERVVVHGPNGSGKTTLLRVLAGQQAPSAGTVVVASVDLVGAEEASRATLRASGLGLIDQHHAGTLRPELDVLANVALQLRVGGQSAASARARASLALGTLGLDHLAQRRTVSLSGGEAQRVAVCAALAHGPRLVLADEPTGELDRVAAEQVYDLLVRATAAVGAALVLVSHDLAAARVADRVVRIRDGRLSEEWTPAGGTGETLVVDNRGWLRLPEPLRRRTGLTDGVLAEEGRAADGSPAILLRHGARATGPLTVGPVPAAGAGSVPTLVGASEASVDGPGGGHHRPAPASPVARAPAAVLENVSAVRGSRTVLSGVWLTVQAGQLTVVQGRSGSGKTTLLRLLTGLERPDAGTVRVGGFDLAGLDRAGLARLRRQHVAVAGQGGSLVEALDVTANLELARDARGLPRDDVAVRGWIELLGLTPLRHRPVRALSGGERQRVAVARALATDRPLAVLDEPTSAQDEAGAERLAELLVRAAAAGSAVVVATHDPVLLAAADHVLTLG